MRKRHSLFPAAALLVAAACALPSPERQLLIDFFDACQRYDTTLMTALGTATCNPRTDGVVDSFELVDVEETGGRKAVTIDARVRPPGALAATERRIVATLEQIGGRWLVTRLR